MSKSATENFVVFGTAFPETTDKDRRAGRTDAGQFVPTWKQEARDEQGRRRFHGAFTGGFSAGYFNTVGSKEGWTPTNYVSSRNARNERKEARPEDYMDEEDLEAMAGARKLVATEEFDILGGTERELAARRKQQQEEEARGGGLDMIGSSLINMFGPPKDSVGVRLLRKMGWRPGQGIGPRIKRRIQDEDDDGQDEDEDETLNNMTFAPRDTPIENFQAKRDTYGLGFDLSASVPEVAEMKRLRELARQKETSGAQVDKKNRSSFGVFDTSGRKVEAFGLGALEDDDDEEDVYRTDTANYHTALYDDEGGLTRDQVKMQSMKRKREEIEEEKAEKSKHLLLKCSDGRPPLRGFHVSDQPQQIGKWHAPPQVPADFTGQHVVKEEDQDSQANAPKISQESLFSFEERGNALGEKPIEQRSVFDYMPKHSKDKLDQAVSYFIDIGKDKSQLSEFPTIPKDVAKLALQGFMPFGDNLKKQARYRSYLENQAGMLTEDGVPKTVLPIPEGLTYEVGMKELDEFAKAARIFRPISAMMSGRFTSASETFKNIEVVNFEGGLKTEEQYRKEKEQRIQEQPKPEKKQLSQEAEAAAMKMFGSLTRTVKPFYPNRLVCKRFNVKDPHPNHDHTADKAAGRTQGGNKDALSKESMDTILNERLPLPQTFASVSEMTASLAQPDDDPMMKAVVPKPSQRSQDATAPTTAGIDTTKGKGTEEEEGPPLDYERPSMDIFKAIFDDSDSEEEQEDQQEQETTTRENTATTTPLDQDDFIGPPMPPQPATADIPLTTASALASPKDEPFRPMFKRASERKDSSVSSLLPQVVSEQVVVQPFKPRSSRQKRRQVDVFDDEQEAQQEGDGHKKRERSHSRSSSPSPDRSSRRDGKSSKKSRKSKSSSSRRDRSRDDERSSSSSRRRHDDRKKRKSDKKSRHRSSSSHNHRHHPSSRHKHREEKEDDLEAFWVEKEHVIQESDKPTKGGRMSAADMWQ